MGLIATEVKHEQALDEPKACTPCNVEAVESAHDRAKAWLCFAQRNLELAKLLTKEGYYEDVIGFELQQSIEKSFKAILVNYHKPVIDTHDLNVLREAVSAKYLIEDYMIVELLEIATGYYLNARYPNSDYSVPESKTLFEIEELAHLLFEGIANVLEIEIGDLCTS